MHSALPGVWEQLQENAGLGFRQEDCAWKDKREGSVVWEARRWTTLKFSLIFLKSSGWGHLDQTTAPHKWMNNNVIKSQLIKPKALQCHWNLSLKKRSVYFLCSHFRVVRAVPSVCVPLKMSWKLPLGSSQSIQLHIIDILNETINVLTLHLTETTFHWLVQYDNMIINGESVLSLLLPTTEQIIKMTDCSIPLQVEIYFQKNTDTNECWVSIHTNVCLYGIQIWVGLKNCLTINIESVTQTIFN